MTAQPSDSSACKTEPSESAPADALGELCVRLGEELLKAEDGAPLSAKTKALDCLLRKQRLDMDAQSRNEARKSGQIKALEICLEDAKRFPKAQELFRQAFEALRKALDA